MEGRDEFDATGVVQEDCEEHHGVVERLMELRSVVVEIANEAPDGWIEVPRRSPRNVQQQTGVGSSKSPVRKKSRLQPPTNRFAPLASNVQDGRRLKLTKKRRINSDGESTSADEADEAEDEADDEEEVRLDFPSPVKGGKGGKGKASAGKGSKGSTGGKGSAGISISHTCGNGTLDNSV